MCVHVSTPLCVDSYKYGQCRCGGQANRYRSRAGNRTSQHTAWFRRSTWANLRSTWLAQPHDWLSHQTELESQAGGCIPATLVCVTASEPCLARIVMRKEIVFTASVAGAAVVIYLLRRRFNRALPPPPLVVPHVPRPATAQDGGSNSSAYAEYLELCKADGLQQAFVLPDRRDRPLAACTLLLEPKFLRGGTKAAHLTRWAGGGQRMRAELLRQLVEFARAEGAYKAIVDAPRSEARTLRACGFDVSSLTLMQTLSGDGTGSRGSGNPGPMAPRPLGVRPRGGGQLDYALRALRETDGSDRYLSLLRQLSTAPAIDENAYLLQLVNARKPACLERSPPSALHVLHTLPTLM